MINNARMAVFWWALGIILPLIPRSDPEGSRLLLAISEFDPTP